MFCSSCGTSNEAGKGFCAKCGAPLGNSAPSPGGSPMGGGGPMGLINSKPPKTMALIAMCLGIGSMVTPIIAWIISAASTTTTFWGASTVSSGGMAAAAIVSFLGMVSAILALILGAVTMKTLKQANQPAGMAVAGLVLGIVGTVFGVLCTGCFALACIGADSVGW